MKLRVISGTAYVAILLGVYLLKVLVHPLCFDLLTYFMAIVGTFEILRATKESTTKAQRIMVTVFSIIVIPACSISEYFFELGLHVVAICFFVLAVALLSLLVLRYDETTLENIGLSLFAAVYPSVLLCLLVRANHIGVSPVLEHLMFDSNLVILFIFVVSPVADAVALLFGLTMKKRFPKKLAPVLSPNKTVIGAIGGLVGGVVGGIVLYFVYNAIFVGEFINMGLWLPVFIVIGLFGALASEFGDLVESCIKRKVNVKDMGKIMPGHGGVLDRIDGTLFTTMVVYIAFEMIHLFA
jgi:phosphatidate cytidylyltransferase